MSSIAMSSSNPARQPLASSKNGSNNDRNHRIIMAKTHYSALSQRAADAAKKNKEASIEVKVKKTKEEEVTRLKKELHLTQKELDRIYRERGQAHEFAKLISQSEMEERRFDERRRKAVLARAQARARDQCRHDEEVRLNVEREKLWKKLRIDQYSNLNIKLDPIKKRYAAELDNLSRLEKCLEMRLDEKKQKSLTEKQVEKIAEKLLKKYSPQPHICCAISTTSNAKCTVCEESSNSSPCNCCTCNCKECTSITANHCNRGEKFTLNGKDETNELSTILQRVLEKLDKLKMDEEDANVKAVRYENAGSKRSGCNKVSTMARQRRTIEEEENEPEAGKKKSEKEYRREDQENDEEAVEACERIEQLSPLKQSRLYKEAAVNTSTKSLSSFISSESSYAQLPSPIILRKRQKSSFRSANTIAKVIDESLASVESLDKDAFWHSVLRSADAL